MRGATFRNPPLDSCTLRCGIGRAQPYRLLLLFCKAGTLSFFTFFFDSQLMFTQSLHGIRPNLTYTIGHPQVEQVLLVTVMVPFWGRGAEALHPLL